MSREAGLICRADGRWEEISYCLRREVRVGQVNKWSVERFCEQHLGQLGELSSSRRCAWVRSVYFSPFSCFFFDFCSRVLYFV